MWTTSTGGEVVEANPPGPKTLVCTGGVTGTGAHPASRQAENRRWTTRDGAGEGRKWYAEYGVARPFTFA
jgi:hypothetical protein